MIRKAVITTLSLAALGLWAIGWLSVYRKIFVTAPGTPPPIRFIANDVSPATIPATLAQTTCEISHGWIHFGRSSAITAPTPDGFHGLPMLYMNYTSTSAEMVAVPAEVARERSELPPRQRAARRLDPSTTRIVRYTRWWHLSLSPFALSVLLGAYPMVVVIRSHSRRTRLRRLGAICRTCGYNLTGNTSGVCPECGRSFLTQAPRSSSSRG